METGAGERATTREVGNRKNDSISADRNHIGDYKAFMAGQEEN